MNSNLRLGGSWNFSIQKGQWQPFAMGGLVMVMLVTVQSVGTFCLQHVVHLAIRFSRSFVMPGHQTDCAIRRRHFVIPWCLVCILLRISG